ncbi:Caleosin-domain-containing protein [Hortaea werneckii]|nr:Caleosin-domain-containing protein [Hortaea werneckii]
MPTAVRCLPPYDAYRRTMLTASNGDVTADPSARKLYNQLGEKINLYPPGRPYNVSINTAPPTIEREPYIPSEGDTLRDAGTARASIAADSEHPHGTTDGDWAETHKTETVVQQHCLYFDQDGDGVIFPHDTFIACRKWGWGTFLSALATFIINFNLSYPTQPGWLPGPLFRIYINNVHKAKHGSDSMSFDNEGRFFPQKYENVFAKYDKGCKGGQDWSDLLKFHKGQRMAMDFFGCSAVFFECKHPLQPYMGAIC